MPRKLIEDNSKYGLRMNLNKTKYLSVEGSINDIQIKNCVTKSCNDFKQLGSYKARNRNIEMDIQRIIK